MGVLNDSVREILSDMMQQFNPDAMDIPAGRLIDGLRERIERKHALLAERDRTLGAGRIRIGSYMENIGYPELFGYDMNRFFSDPEFLLEMELRQRIFWLDNSLDDGLPGLHVAATVGKYYDMTLFGQQVRHTRTGVPLFEPHPIAQQPDLSLIPSVDFRTSGRMPELIRQYEALGRLSVERYGGALTIGFPTFNRGPLDIYVQLRGYERFVEDALERPQFVHDFLARIVEERVRWNRERRRYLGEPQPAGPTTRVDDDWVNVPFISPAMFREFVMPAYRRIAAAEGTVVGFHTCGVMAPIVEDLLGVFPGIHTLDVSGWNDFEELDRIVDPHVSFAINFKNTFVLSASQAQHREALQRAARVGRRRSVSVSAQAIVRLHPSYEENLSRMNAFIALAREVFAETGGQENSSG